VGQFAEHEARACSVTGPTQGRAVRNNNNTTERSARERERSRSSPATHAAFLWFITMPDMVGRSPNIVLEVRGMVGSSHCAGKFRTALAQCDGVPPQCAPVGSHCAGSAIALLHCAGAVRCEPLHCAGAVRFVGMVCYVGLVWGTFLILAIYACMLGRTDIYPET
jgi:hypothetical protein